MTAVTDQALADGAGPEILTAVAADVAGDNGVGAGDTVTITFSENTAKPEIVADPATIGGSDIDTVLALTPSHTWKHISAIGATSAWNEAGNVLTIVLAGSGATVAVHDVITPSSDIKDVIGDGNTAASSKGITGSFDDATAPTLSTAKVTGGNTITLTFSEAVTTSTADYSNLTLTAGGARGVSTVGGTGTDTITLTFDGDAVGTDETGTIDIAATLTDSALNPIIALNNQAVTDGQAPTLVSAKYTDDTTLEMTFSENMGTADTVDETKITITNNNGDSIAVTDNTAVVDDTKITITTASVGGATDFKIDDAVQGLDLAASAVQDLAVGNANAESLNNGVADGIAPTLTSAKFTGDSQITVVFSEAVTAAAGDFTNLETASGEADLTVAGISGSESTTIVITLNEALGDTSLNAGQIDISSAVVDTAASNAYAGVTDQAVTDGQAPTLVSAVLNSATQVTLTFSENVAEGDSYGDGLSIITLNTSEHPTVTSISDAVVTLTFTDVGTAPYLADGTGLQISASVFDDSAGNQISAIENHAVTDSAAPIYSSNVYDTGTGVLTITFNENLDVDTSDVDLSKIYIVGSDGVTNPLTGSTVTGVTTTTATITLSTLKNWSNNLTFNLSYLKFYAGAVKDLAGNEIAANADDNEIGVDTVAPVLSSVTSYDYATKQLKLVFDEPIKYDNVNVSNIIIANSTTGIPLMNLTEAAVTTTANSATIIITLIDAQRNIIETTWGTPSRLYVRLSAEAVQDLVGNNNTALETGIEITTITHKDQIALTSGWNLISVPYEMDESNSTFAELLAGYNPTMYEYSGVWVTKAGTATVEPLYGYFVNVNHTGVITLTYNSSERKEHPARDLNSRTWYTIGASTQTTENASTLLGAATGKYLDKLYYGVGNSEESMTSSENMVFGRGYWLYTTGTTSIAD